MPNTEIAQLSARLAAVDGARPRLTWYDDAAGPSQGERVELSGRVLHNWVSKAANLLQDELDITVGSRVAMVMPLHWRAVYWALAVWSVGATLGVTTPTSPADALITDDPDLARAHPGAVLVDLAMLSRGHPQAGVAPAALDEARVLATYGDVFDPWDSADPAAPALVLGTGPISADALVTVPAALGAAPRAWVTGLPLGEGLRAVVAALAADGSVVLSRGEAPDAAHRADVEGVTVTLGPGLFG